MKKFINLMMFFLFILSSSTISHALQRVIRFGMEATYPPFEYVNEKGQIRGYDIDIANAICEQMQAKCEFGIQAFGSLIPSLKLGKFDALISAVSITSERSKQVGFTSSYYELTGSFVASIKNNYSLQDIKTKVKVIGTQSGTTFEGYLLAQYKQHKLQVRSYASIQDAFLDLKAKRVDMVLADTPIAIAWLKKDNNLKEYTIVDKPIVDHECFGSGYGIAVRKNNIALLNEINQALNTIKANGTYDAITSKYFTLTAT